MSELVWIAKGPSFDLGWTCYGCGLFVRRLLVKPGTLFRLCKDCVEKTVSGAKKGWWIDRHVVFVDAARHAGVDEDTIEDLLQAGLIEKFMEELDRRLRVEFSR